jgi:acetoin utilization deacetylase AcuC-like enzyme
MAKFRVLKETLVNSGAFRGTFVTPTHPFDDDGMTHVYAVHDQDYVDRFLANALTHDEKRRIGLAFNEHLVYRTLAEVGGTVATCDLAMETGLACNLAGGTHHAHRTFGRYECV